MTDETLTTEDEEGNKDETLFREQYHFEFENHEDRDTSNLEGDPSREAVETLAEFGKRDDEAIVTVSGYETLG